MKQLLMSLLVIGAFSTTAIIAHAEETVSEKAADAGRDAKRTVKKGYHRTKEAVCMKSDAKCAAEKAKHKAEEAGDAIKDKAKEVKEKVD